MKIMIRIIMFLMPVIGYGQTQSSLSELLWDRVQNCYKQFEDMDDDGELDYEKIDDSKNGYLEISGGWPTCGCGCSSIVGAYRNSKNEYRLIQSDKENCNWLNRISSNTDLTNILPPDFGLGDFTLDQNFNKVDHPVFFLDFEVPRIGTDTKVQLKLVPFGLFPDGNDLICFEYSESDNHKMISGIRSIAVECKDDKTLDYLLTGEFENIGEEDMICINKNIGIDDSRFKSIAEINKYINDIKRIYDIYLSLEATEMIFGWNRDESRFFIKKKSNKPEKISFKEFLIKNIFWGPIC